MQGRKVFQPKQFYVLSLDDLVAPDNLYRSLNAAIDLHFLYSVTAQYYGVEGNESIDPVVFFKERLQEYIQFPGADTWMFGPDKTHLFYNQCVGKQLRLLIFEVLIISLSADTK